MQAINNFNDITHLPLRHYNRMVMTTNLLEDGGEVAAKAYLEQFDDQERRNIFLLITMVQKKGKKYVRDLVTKDLETEYNSSEES